MMQSNRKPILVLGIVLLSASLVLAAFMLQPSAADLLTQAVETVEGINDGHAIIELQLDLPDKSGTGIVEVWGKLDVGPVGEPAFRIEILEASETEAIGATAVSDGSNFWLWHPGRDTVYVATAEELKELVAEKMADHEFGDRQNEGDAPETAEEKVAKLLEFFTAERHGTEDVGDAPAYKLRLVPIPEQMPDEVRTAGGFINAWIAIESKAPLAIEYAEGAAGYGKAAATFLEFNQGIDDDIFAFVVPDGAEVVSLVEEIRARQVVPLDFESLSPNRLPNGAMLLESTQIRGAMVERYALPDGKSFTVAQGPSAINYQPDVVGTAVTVRGVEGLLFSDDDGMRTLLSWTEGEISFWIGGDLTAEEALDVAESLR